MVAHGSNDNPRNARARCPWHGGQFVRRRTVSCSVLLKFRCRLASRAFELDSFSKSLLRGMTFLRHASNRDDTGRVLRAFWRISKYSCPTRKLSYRPYVLQSVLSNLRRPTVWKEWLLGEVCRQIHNRLARMSFGRDLLILVRLVTFLCLV